MADGVELATAWVRLVPSAEGITDALTGAFAPAEKAGADSGAKAGAAWAGKLKGALGVAAIGAAVVGAFKGLYEVGSIFDDVTDTIRVGTGAQGEALDGLVQVAKNVGANVPASFDKIGSTVADLNTRLGLSGETLTTVSAQYLEAGRILGEDVDINKTTASFSAFGVEGAAVSGAMDTLFQVSQATGVGLNDLATKTQTAAPLVKNLGFSFEDTASLIGTLDKAGLDANKMLATLGPGLVKMSKDGEQPAKVFPRVVGELESFIEKGDVASAIDLAGGIFGTRGAAQFVAALQSGAVNLDDLQGAVGATGDTILGVAAETADFGEQWQIFKNRALTAIEPLGTAIFNVLGNGMKFVNSLFSDMPDLAGTFAPLLSTFAEMGQIIWSSLGPALKQIWDAVAPLIPVLLDLWMSVSPVNLVFQALAPVLPMIADMVGQLAGVLGGVLAAVLPTIVELVGSFSAILGSLFQALMPVVMTLIEALFPIMTALIPVVVGLLDAFAPLIGALVEALAPILMVVADIAAAILVPAFHLVAGIVKVLADVITWLVKNVIAPFFNGVVIPAVKAVAAAFKGNFGPLGDFFAGLWDGIVSGFKWFINVLIDGINGFVSGLNEVGNFVSDVTGGAVDFHVPRLPRLAEGATILPRRGGTAAILAEAGRPETVVDTGLLNRALEEGLSGDGDGFGLRPGDRVILEVEGQPLTAVAKRVVRSAFPSPQSVTSQFAGH